MTDSRPHRSDDEPTELDRNPAGALTVIDHKPASAFVVPRAIADLGEAATLRFVDFFTANIRNANTRAASAPITSRPTSSSWPRSTRHRP
jgi:hypothetical protein